MTIYEAMRNGIAGDDEGTATDGADTPPDSPAT
jgi:hypothetical protein